MIFIPPLSLGQRLVHERLRLNWSQEEVANALGTTARSINRWEHDKAVPHPHYKLQLCRVFNRSSETLFGTISSDESTPSPSVLWNIPYQHNPFFTGRDGILSHLHETFHIGKSAAFTQAQALSGLGGIGKTQTAIEYAYRFRNDYSAVFWLRAETHDSLIADFVTLAQLLHLPEKDELDRDRVIKAVNQWLTRPRSGY